MCRCRTVSQFRVGKEPASKISGRNVWHHSKGPICKGAQVLLPAGGPQSLIEGTLSPARAAAESRVHPPVICQLPRGQLPHTVAGLSGPRRDHQAFCEDHLFRVCLLPPAHDRRSSAHWPCPRAAPVSQAVQELQVLPPSVRVHPASGGRMAAAEMSRRHRSLCAAAQGAAAGRPTVPLRTDAWQDGCADEWVGRCLCCMLPCCAEEDLGCGGGFGGE
mmetsp:Transcript_20749/g.59205  ORF Transcript_20749/g.59205 Transcript_20749/m.59205 type:complete len:218 (+) Transcript_20749:591-1244(+)